MIQSKREADWQMIEAQKRILRARLGYRGYREAQRLWAEARLAQRQAWIRESRQRQAE